MYPERSGFTKANNFIVVMLLMTIVATGCGPTGEVRLDMADNGRQIEAEVGQILAISLESNPTTGFGWELIELEDPILQLMGEAEFQPSESNEIVGAGGTETFRFELESTGQTTLTLVYRRSWEEGVEPLETFSLNVIVH
ncbi:MAG: protease inhibitor I42 family protein [Anaerolineales bacterium]